MALDSSPSQSQRRNVYVVSKGWVEIHWKLLNISSDTDEILVDSPEDAFTSDPLRDALRGMLMNIQSIKWQRIDVLFESMLAHERVIAKRSDEVPPNESGVDIAHHIADTLLLR